MKSNTTILVTIIALIVGIVLGSFIDFGIRGDNQGAAVSTTQRSIKGDVKSDIFGGTSSGEKKYNVSCSGGFVGVLDVNMNGTFTVVSSNGGSFSGACTYSAA